MRPHVVRGVSTGEPVVSVVMPARNTAATVAEAVRSVLRQTLGEFELIVVDDGSTDETVSIVRELADPRVVLLEQQHGGAAAARNAGIRVARSSVITLVDSDDLLLPTYLEVMAGLIRGNPGVGFAHTDAFVVSAATGRVRRTTATQRYRPSERPTSAEAFHLALLRINFIYNAVTAPKSVFDAVGLFDESLRATIDYEMWLRIAANGYNAVEAPYPLAVYRSGREDSISSDHERVLSNTLRVYEIAAEQHPGSARARTVAHERQAQVAAELAAVRGARSIDALGRRARDLVARTRARVLPDRVWYPRNHPPALLTEALPDVFPPG